MSSKLSYKEQCANVHTLTNHDGCTTVTGDVVRICIWITGILGEICCDLQTVLHSHLFWKRIANSKVGIAFIASFSTLNKEKGEHSTTNFLDNCYLLVRAIPLLTISFNFGSTCEYVYSNSA